MGHKLLLSVGTLLVLLGVAGYFSPLLIFMSGSGSPTMQYATLSTLLGVMAFLLGVILLVGGFIKYHHSFKANAPSGL